MDDANRKLRTFILILLALLVVHLTLCSFSGHLVIRLVDILPKEVGQKLFPIQNRPLERKPPPTVDCVRRIIFSLD